MTRLRTLPKKWRYKMLPKDDVLETSTGDAANSETPPGSTAHAENDDASLVSKPWWHRGRYSGALHFNLAAFILPALYSTLPKLWITNIDAAMVVTTDVYTYIGTVSEVTNEGLPRAAWVIIGDQASRSLPQQLQLTHTVILFQAVLGLILSIAFVSGAATFAEGFVPVDAHRASLTYVCISAFSAVSGAVETAVAAATRALDKPDVPLAISSAKFSSKIVLDLLIISRFRVGSITPTVNTQAIIQLVCNLVSALFGLGYVLYANSRRVSQFNNVYDGAGEHVSLRPSLAALIVLLRPGLVTCTESAIRNALYLWLVSTIVALGSTYATAWLGCLQHNTMG